MEVLERMPFTAQKKIFKRLAEIADSTCLSQEEREKYEESCKVADDWYSGMYGSWQDGMKEGLEKGIEKGLEKGQNKEKFAIAQKMLLAGEPDTKIILFTGLTQEQIDNLKH